MFNMELYNNSRCDECDHLFDNDEILFCSHCYNALFEENEVLKNKIEELEHKIKEVK